jgi:hypothetical protein
MNRSALTPLALFHLSALAFAPDVRTVLGIATAGVLCIVLLLVVTLRQPRRKPPDVVIHWFYPPARGTAARRALPSTGITTRLKR